MLDDPKMVYTYKSLSLESDLPCRIACSVEGIELFMYNNSMAYDKIRDMLNLSSEKNNNKKSKVDEKRYSSVATEGKLDIEDTASNHSNSSLKRIMPIQFTFKSGAIMVGNSDIKTMLVFKASQSTGTFSISTSRSAMDYYKFVIDAILEDSQLHLKENMDYEPLNADVENEKIIVQKKSFVGFLSSCINFLCFPLRKRRYSDIFNLHNMMKEEKTQNPQKKENPTYHQEYARVTSILECKKMKCICYVDIPGPVKASGDFSSSNGIGIDIGNGGLPPEIGVRAYMWDSTIHYGPWTNRNIMEMKDYFFPSANRNYIPNEHLKEGDYRIHTAFEVYLKFMNEVNIRVPMREASKDWKYSVNPLDLDIGSDGYYIRPYGWLNIKAKEGTFIKAVTPLVCGPEGFISTLDMVLKDTDINTSVNYASFLNSERIEIKMSMPTPIQWNGFRRWDFKVTLKSPVIFLLRDHIYLLFDLLKDWTTSSPIDILYFTPMIYHIQYICDNPTIYFCVNEHNIINYPNSIDDNAYFRVKCEKSLTDINLPFMEFQPETTSIGFSISGDNVTVGLSLPASHTFNSFISEDDSNTATVLNISTKGTYEYYNSVDIYRHIESINLHMKIRNTTVKLFGTLIRYILILQDNYFGVWDSFLTIDEYRQHNLNRGDWLEQKKRRAEFKPHEDPFEVFVFFEIEDGRLLLPENLYECKSYSQFVFQELQLELRNLDIYMDMYLNISPVWLSKVNTQTDQNKNLFGNLNYIKDPRNCLYIDCLRVYAHRLFGPLPESATYLCHWEFDIGSISGEVKPEFLSGLICFAQSFVYNLIDEDNAIPQEMKVKELPDVSFVKLYMKKIDVVLMTVSSATKFSINDGISLEFDNLINIEYSQRITIKIPEILTQFLANPEQSHFKNTLETSNEYSWLEVAQSNFGVNITVYRHTNSWQKNRNEQQTFIKLQDYPTRRCVRLYEEVQSSSQASTHSLKSFNNHCVGVLYAPPFRPFMFGRVYDASELHKSELSSSHSSMYEFHDYHNLSDAPFLPVKGDKEFINLFDEESIKSEESFYTANNSDDEEIIDIDLNNEGCSISSKSVSYEKSDEDSSSQNIDSSSSENESTIEYDKSIKTSIPPSIPYSNYLRRFKIERSDMFFDQDKFLESFNPPLNVEFVPKQYESVASSHWNEYVNDKTYSEKIKGKYHSKNNSFGVYDGFFGEDEVTTTIVVEATKPTVLNLTPIFIKIIQELTEEIMKDDWKLESVLDSLQIKYIEQLTRYLTHQYTCSQFSIILPEIYFYFIQNVFVPDELPLCKSSDSRIKTKFDSNDNILCAAHINIYGFKLNGTVKFEDSTYSERTKKVVEPKLKLKDIKLQSEIESITVKVNHISNQHSKQTFSFGIPPDYLDKKNHRSNLNKKELQTNESNVFNLSMTGFELKLMSTKLYNCLDLSLKSINSVLIAESIEILAGAIYSWLDFVDDLQEILRSYQDLKTRKTQELIHAISRFSKFQIGISDPVFLTTPTAMIRLGSNNFRHDCGWKLLGHMRHCLRSMSQPERKILQQNITLEAPIKEINRDSMFKNVVENFSNWRSWEVTQSEISSCRLFTQVFDQENSKKAKKSNDDIVCDVIELLKSKLNVFKFQLSSFKFTIYEEETTGLYKIENGLFFDSLRISVEAVVKKYISSFNSESNFADNYKNALGSNGYIDIVSYFSLGNNEVSVNPVIMAFAQHMILVCRMFSEKLHKRHNSKDQYTQLDSLKFPMDFLGINPTSSDYEDAFSNPLLSSVLNDFDCAVQLYINLDQFEVMAHAQELKMNTKVSGVQGSLLISKPKKLSLKFGSHTDQESERTARKQSSNRGRSNTITDPISLVDATCRIVLIDIKFVEMSNPGKSINPNLLFEIRLDKTSIISNISLIPKRPKKTFKSSASKPILNVFLNFDGFYINIPQSLLKLYRFLESWQEEQGSRFHFLFNNLVKEWEDKKKIEEIGVESSLGKKDSSSANSIISLAKSFISEKIMDRKLNILVSKFSVQADLLPSLSMKYDTVDFFTVLSQKHVSGVRYISYSVKLAQQNMKLITKSVSEIERDLLKMKKISQFSIPGVRSIGSLKSEDNDGFVQHNVNSTILLDKIILSLDASIIDSILTTQSLLDNEINDLIELLSYTKRKKGLNKSKNQTLSSSSKNDFKIATAKYNLKLSLSDLSIYIAGPSSVCLLRSYLLEAIVSNDKSNIEDLMYPILDRLYWSTKVQSISLSLHHIATEKAHQEAYIHTDTYSNSSLAYITVDLKAQNYIMECSGEEFEENKNAYENDQLDLIFIDFSKVHSVMQPIALGKLAEFYFYYASEIEAKQKSKSEELSQLSINTHRILEAIYTNDEKSIDRNDESKKSAIKTMARLKINNIGIAMPFDSNSVNVSKFADSKTVNAFFLSVSSMVFLTNKVERGSLKIQNAAIQFVKKFNRNNPVHFSSKAHPYMNQAYFPSVSCYVSAVTNEDSVKKVVIDTKVSEFEINVDGAIVDYILNLGDIYNGCKNRFDSAASEIESNPKNAFKSSLNSNIESDKANETITEPVNLSIECYFLSNGGVVKMYPKNYSDEKTKKPENSESTTSYTGRRHFSKRAINQLSSINLPAISAYFLYRTVLSSPKSSNSIPTRLYADIMIHESVNTIRPEIAQFLLEILSDIKLGTQKSGSKSRNSEPQFSLESNIDISVLLRLSAAQLNLTCQPLSKVVFSVGWEQSEFLFDIYSADDSTKRISCIASMNEVSMMVKHHFSRDASLNAYVDKIILNFILAPQKIDNGFTNISVLIKIPNLAGGIDMRHFEDILILYACWIQQYISYESYAGDRIQNQNININAEKKNNEKSEFSLDISKFLKHIAIEIDSIRFSADINPNIGKLTLIVDNPLTVMLELLTSRRRCLHISIEKVNIVSEGRLSGDFRLKKTAFYIKLYQGLQDETGERRTFCLLFTSLGMDASLEYEFQNIFGFATQPLNIKMDGVRILSLSNFDISVIFESLAIQMSTKTIPALFEIREKFNELIDKKVSQVNGNLSRNSKFQLNSNKNPIHKKNTQIICEKASLNSQFKVLAKIINIVVYPNQFVDSDNIAIQTMDFELELELLPITNNRITRRINIVLANAMVAKNVMAEELIKHSRSDTISDNRYIERIRYQLKGKKLFGVPGTKVIMKSTQLGNCITYIFDSVFAGRINVSLNLGLIKYLQEMVNVFKNQITKTNYRSKFKPHLEVSLDVEDSVRKTNTLVPDKNVNQPNLVSIPTAAIPGSSTSSSSSKSEDCNKEKYTYSSVQPINFQPQLQVMGDATPPVEWLGFKRERIPGLLHENITLELDKLILDLWNQVSNFQTD